MPRVATNPVTFLTSLEAGRAAARAGEVGNAAALSRAAGVTWRIMERWIVADPGFPVVQRGRVGQPWLFDLVAVLDYLIDKARSLATGKKARQAEIARLAGFGAADGVTPSPSVNNEPGAAADRAADARGMKAIAEAQMTTHRLKQMQGEYVRADLVTALLADLMTTMQSETLAISAKLDPAGQWPADHRADVEAELRTVLVTVRDKMDAALISWGPGGRA